jgi:NAD+ synthase (glutamine-hydrolysing)
MKDGYIRVAAVTPEIRVGDPVYNREQIEVSLKKAVDRQVKVAVFPELCLTGYTCSDLFWQTPLLEKAKEQLLDLIESTCDLNVIAFVGLPWEYNGNLYNVMAAFSQGVLLGLIPKSNIPNYSEFYELRHFTAGPKEPIVVGTFSECRPYNEILMGTNLLFECRDIPGLVIGGEICEDVWVPDSPGVHHALEGATILVNCSASDEMTGKDSYRRDLIRMQSARLVCAYIYANAGEGESTTDLVFGGQNIIAENGNLLKESTRFQNGCMIADVDLERIRSERRRMGTFQTTHTNTYVRKKFDLCVEPLQKLERYIDSAPFVPSRQEEREARCQEILDIQSCGLWTRLKHTGCKAAVVGISGGLDSTLALIVTVRAFDRLQIPRENIVAVTMPCFGTTDRTYHNACELVHRLGATLKEIPIQEAVRLHFRDIEHDENIHDITYENGQARERTQILMDLANKYNGMVIGTGDLSELALGWATYNGDHMSMYAVNASVPKTLVRYLVSYYADNCQDGRLSEVLRDILDTPVSPELLPPTEGKISQKTEDIVGPYELHDFFLYHMLRFGYHPAKINRMANIAFADIYDKETILKWQKTFTRRFFSQQFKRSCLPDGPKVGSVAVSPRGDLRMPSDATARVWMEELEEL